MKPEMNEQTYVCSVVFLDIVQFSQEPITVQSAWRDELAALINKGLENMNPDHRIIVDSGDGAAIGFLLHPEEALSFVSYMVGELPKLRNFALRVGAHLGPLRVVQGMNGLPNPVGDGINSAQRVMSFAGINEVLVSRAFYEAVAWLSPSKSIMFLPCGKQADKHGREHDLFRIVPQIPATTNVQGTGTAQPSAGKWTSFDVKAVFVAVLMCIVGLWLWTAPGNRESDQTAPPLPPPAVKSAEPDSAVPAAAPAKLPQAAPVRVAPRFSDSPAAARPATPEAPHPTVIAAPGKAAAASDGQRDGYSYCPNCSCTDLMTKLSLGISLDENGRRYMNEHCNK